MRAKASALWVRQAHQFAGRFARPTRLEFAGERNYQVCSPRNFLLCNPNSTSYPMQHRATLMEERAASVQLDPLLRPFVEAQDEDLAAARLAELLTFVTPAIKKIVGRSQAPEDDLQEAMQQLIGVLWACRCQPQQQAIGDFQRYAAVVAAHVCRRRLRAEHPAYHTLKASLRHTFRNDARLALWEAREREWVCGVAELRGRADVDFSSPRLTSLLHQPTAYDEEILPGQDAQRVPQAELLYALFAWVGHAVNFDQLVRIVFELRRLEDLTPVSSDEDAEARPLSEVLPALSPLPEAESQWRQFLAKLWAEIEQLPPLQRIAYLLNFTAGEGALEIFWLHGVASVRRIGTAVQLTEEQFARVWQELTPAASGQAQWQSYDEKFALLWRHLPLNDQVIARLLGTERQKVINLRKAAGDRLARRLAIFRSNG